LTLFTKEPDDCQNTFERIIYVLKNMDILERMPWMAQDAVFKRLASIAEIAAMSEKQRLEYDESLRKYRDTLSVMEGQYQEGMKKGLEKGNSPRLSTDKLALFNSSIQASGITQTSCPNLSVA